jgi:serine/threonine protein kinase
LIRVSKVLGKGLFGKVCLGRHVPAGEAVAVKIMRIKDKATEERVFQEINTAKKIDHPNIVKILDYQRNDQYFVIIFEYCSGGDLEAANLFFSISELETAVLKIGDFGFAKCQIDNPLYESMLGTPVYMAPERLRVGSLCNFS